MFAQSEPAAGATTPIKHVVVIFDENISFDHYFGTYPNALNPEGEPPFVPAPNTPNVNGLTPALLTSGAYLDRCGYGSRLPFLVISPYARQNYVSHTLNDTTSILRFIEDNWGLGRLGDQSFDAMAGSILDSFDFVAKPHLKPVLLDETSGEVKKKK